MLTSIDSRDSLRLDWVFLRLQPFKQKSMHKKLGELGPKFYGPYEHGFKNRTGLTGPTGLIKDRCLIRSDPLKNRN